MHAIFWQLYAAHPAILKALADLQSAAAAASASEAASSDAAAAGASAAAVGAVEGGLEMQSGAHRAAAQVLAGHKVNYPCNSVSRDVVVFMEAKKPILCNNQKKVRFA